MDDSRENIMKIKINAIKLFGYHGLYDIEKENGQNFIIDIVVETSYQDKCHDSIENTIDYVEITNQVKATFNKNRYNLIEALAVDISGAIMKNKKVEATRVSIKKTSPPIELDLESVEVEYREER